MKTRSNLLTFPLLLVAAFVACEEGVTAPEGALTEVQPDCLECMRSLAECSSTAQTERMFVGCRDAFQECQEKMDLGPDECGRPTNEQGCELCQDRLEKCDGKECRAEFSVCKTFLMTRDQDECGEKAKPTLATCEDCVESLAACAFGGDDISVCEKGFDTCREANELSESECSKPGVQEVCDACDAQHETCASATAEGCVAKWTSCVNTLATEGACGAGPNMGGGGEGGGGSGGTCAHDGCTEGEALDAGCGACAAAVCEIDSFCCTTSYDAYCVAQAQTVAACGCAPPAETCAHDVCVAGEPLDPACSQCASDVCDVDGFCCTTEWDDYCILQAESVCNATCT